MAMFKVLKRVIRSLWFDYDKKINKLEHNLETIKRLYEKANEQLFDLKNKNQYLCDELGKCKLECPSYGNLMRDLTYKPMEGLKGFLWTSDGTKGKE
jgi:hypothetical protein